MKEVGGRKKRRRRRAGTLGATFLKCNQPGAALLPNVNRGQTDSLSQRLMRVKGREVDV